MSLPCFRIVSRCYIEKRNRREVLDNTVKIPTGRMPYAERAKLREDMTRLDKRREDNIAARREATRARYAGPRAPLDAQPREATGTETQSSAFAKKKR